MMKVQPKRDYLVEVMAPDPDNGARLSTVAFRTIVAETADVAYLRAKTKVAETYGHRAKVRVLDHDGRRVAG